MAKDTKARGGGLRETMPVCAAWIDALRSAFGREAIDAQIAASLRGEPTFYAREAGHAVGVPVAASVERASLRFTGAPFRVGRDRLGNTTIEELT